jgi:hypothetical protein
MAGLHYNDLKGGKRQSSSNNDVESSAITCWQNGGNVADPKQPKLTAALFGYSRRQRQARGGVFQSLRGVCDEIVFRIGGIAFGANLQWYHKASCQRRLSARSPSTKTLSSGTDHACLQ